ncbi:hypothetical protein [Acetobacter syzygii]|uniref:Uncharacterized protein n=1 Tax=Acetobacter syzygii TaxID=146476 RepID=A0A270BIE5_9PROT|nr:hypothetical protein [Acetobacter syzygii]NSL91415.1 hypothetical protein [Acetobacter syzygii]PAL24787.1 hypothetical protein B9K05_08820 [Acetobacter syzygii]PAL24901.1 hypothetical protein B9K04_08310 [Acetobacter syzygii]GAN70657.1 hypothetical protein Absy_008_170 [Acetobacter syzygii]GBR65624.1 hypothetical protein AA0483_1939 [Acetobacter syzygii NRIC 0483]
MEPHTTCFNPPPAQADAYTQAALRGLFSTDTLPSATAEELTRYEQAIRHLRAASHSLQWPCYSDAAFARTQHHYCEESIGEIVQTVRDLLERHIQAQRAALRP